MKNVTLLWVNQSIFHLHRPHVQTISKGGKKKKFGNFTSTQFSSNLNISFLVFSCRLLRRDECTFFAVPAHDPVLPQSYFFSSVGKIPNTFQHCCSSTGCSSNGTWNPRRRRVVLHNTAHTTRATRLALGWKHAAIFFPGLVSARKWRCARTQEEIRHQTLFGAWLQTRWLGCIPSDGSYVKAGCLI